MRCRRDPESPSCNSYTSWYTISVFNVYLHFLDINKWNSYSYRNKSYRVTKNPKFCSFLFYYKISLGFIGTSILVTAGFEYYWVQFGYKKPILSFTGRLMIRLATSIRFIRLKRGLHYLKSSPCNDIIFTGLRVHISSYFETIQFFVSTNLPESGRNVILLAIIFSNVFLIDLFLFKILFWHTMAHVLDEK